MTAEARLYFEDYVPGSVRELGPAVVDEAEIVEFARRYDPQPIPPTRSGPAAARSAA